VTEDVIKGVSRNERDGRDIAVWKRGLRGTRGVRKGVERSPKGEEGADKNQTEGGQKV